MSKSDVPSWDLSALFNGIEDPAIKLIKESVLKKSKKFAKKHKSTINEDITPSELLVVLEEYSKIVENLNKFGIYASLIHSKDTQSDSINKFYQNALEFVNAISNELLFFELEWAVLKDDHAKSLINLAELAEYKHFLTHERVFKDYRLSEKEELILSKKSQTGSTAFVRLYNETFAGLTYKIEENKEEYSYAEITNILSKHQDRELRIKAANSLTEAFIEKSSLSSFILNTIMLDKSVSDEIRDYKYPQESTLLSYEIQKETLDKMSSTIENNYSIVEKFYNKKSELQKLDTLNEVDRYSDIYQLEEENYSWEQAKEIILDSFTQFSPTFADIAKMFFDNNWIDAEVTKGKDTGAFCSLGLPSTNPYILLNFTGKQRDITVLAHELGHGIHAYLSRDNNILQYWPSTATAEIASVFCESVVLENILKKTNNKKQQINIIGEKIQDTFATIFRQNSFYLFESDIHKHRRESGELSKDEFNNYFQKRVQSMFGSSLTLSEGHKNWWIPVSHFFKYNFYVFTYSFGETLARALYAKYNTEGDSFTKEYIKALSTGGSLTPYEITSMMGVDINKDTFWEDGLKLIDNKVDEFIATSNQLQRAIR